jgi:N-acetylmuramoyl-L-alanine amidase
MSRRGILLLVFIGVIIGSLALAGVFKRSTPPAQPPEVVGPERPVITIAIDPGHGGRDPGGVAGEVLEKDLNLQIANRLAELVEQEPQIVAVLTRTSDITVDNELRLQLAEQAGAEIFLSVHVNAFSDESVHGIETLVDDTRSQDDPSWKLAELIQNALITTTQARDRGVRSQPLYLQHTELPSVSAEVGFLSSPEEREKLLDSAYQDKIAEGLLQGVIDYLKEMGKLEEQV